MHEIFDGLDALFKLLEIPLRLLDGLVGLSDGWNVLDDWRHGHASGGLITLLPPLANPPVIFSEESEALRERRLRKPLVGEGVSGARP